MNKYSSIERVLTARNLFEGTISPPNDFTLTPVTGFQQLVNNPFSPNAIDESYISRNTSFTIRKVGLFCNFADGLVFKNPWQNIRLRISVGLYYESSTVAGTIVKVNNSKTVTGAGFVPLAPDTLAPGDIISLFPEEFHIIDTITDDNNATLTDYPFYDDPAGAWTKLENNDAGGDIYIDYFKIRELNYFHDIDFNYSPQLFTGLSGTSQWVIIKAQIFYDNSVTDPDIDFLTKTIDTSYDQDLVHFDAKLLVEYTKG
jgi:hypothetical protein